MSLIKYTKSAIATRVFILGFDTILSCISFYFAFLLSNNMEFIPLPDWQATMIIVIIVRVLSFKLFHAYSVIIRYSGVHDLEKLFYAVIVGSVTLICLYLGGFFSNLSIAVFLTDFILLSFLLAGYRIGMRLVHEFLFSEKNPKTNVVIFGAGKLGSIALKVIHQSPNSNYKAIAIFDDNPNVHLKFLNGIPVFDTVDFEKIILKHKVEKVIIAVKKLSLVRKNQLVDRCLKKNLKVLQIPSATQWLNGNLQVSQIKEVKIEDLLNRFPISLDKENIKSELFEKTILITGGAGSIGSELVKQIIHFKPHKVIIIDQAETPLVNLGLEIKENYNFSEIVTEIANVSNYKRMKAIFKKYKPNIVFHAAAYKHVPIMEDYPGEAINVNVKGTKNISDLSNKFNTEKFVMVSTDKAVNPTNVMGASKRIAEMYIQSLNTISKTQYITTRFGNVLGSNGSVIPRFKKQIEEGKAITVTHPEITRYFMTIPEASQLVLEAGAMGKGGEIYLFDMGESVKILTLAEKLIKLAGYQPYEDIDIVFTGLRPGEKLKEELLTKKENSIPTHHPKITKAKVQLWDIDLVKQRIDQLIIAAENESENMHIVSLMKKIVPEYLSNNSVFESIDKKQ